MAKLLKTKHWVDEEYFATQRLERERCSIEKPIIRRQNHNETAATITTKINNYRDSNYNDNHEDDFNNNIFQHQLEKKSSIAEGVHSHWYNVVQQYYIYVGNKYSLPAQQGQYAKTTITAISYHHKCLKTMQQQLTRATVMKNLCYSLFDFPSSSSSRTSTTVAVENDTTFSVSSTSPLSYCRNTRNATTLFNHTNATLEFQRKTHVNTNGVRGVGSHSANNNNNNGANCSNTSYNSNLDMRSCIYLTLLILFHCCVLIHASTATAIEAAAATTTTTTANIIITNLPSYNRTDLKRNDVLLTPSAKLQNNHYAVNNNGYGNSNGNGNSSYMAKNIVATTTTTTTTSILSNIEHRLLFKRDAANVPGEDEDDSSSRDDEFDEYENLINNKSAKGKYIGAPCNEMKCEPTLLHVTCDKETLTCGCEKNYPVQLGLIKGCGKPKKLGEQCFYDETCMYNDENSLCVQVRHNALCQCASGFHSVSYTKPTRRVFCTQDLSELSSDLPTLLGVSTGIAVLAGLICLVLHLFSKTKYPRHRNFGDANLPPPIMYSSDTGIPLTVQSARPSSRSSIRSIGSIGSYGNRRFSTIGAGAGAGGTITHASGGVVGSKGILVSTSRTGSRRPSLASVHSTSSSVRSYSMMRFEKEAQQKEIRQEMKLRLARLQHQQQQQQLTQNRPQIVIGDTMVMHHHSIGAFGGGGVGGGGAGSSALNRITMVATPSPLTPNSLDELLPVVDELQEYSLKNETITTESVAAATISAIRNVVSATPGTSATATIRNMTAITEVVPSEASTASTATMTSEIAAAAAYIGPCSSSTEAL